MNKITNQYPTIPLPFLKQEADKNPKLDTQATIAIFLRVIPKEVIERAKRDFSDSLTCLEGSASPPQPLKGATLLKDSDTRKLMVLTRLYFFTKTLKELTLNNDPQFEEETFTKNQKELSTFMNLIDGVDLVGGEETAKPVLSADFVFSSEDWYREEANKLLGPIDDVLKFLQEKNYTLSTEKKEGAVAIYCRSTTKTATHYGVVSHGRILSKFGTNPVYSHLEEAVHYIHGNQIFYVIPPN